MTWSLVRSWTLISMISSWIVSGLILGIWVSTSIARSVISATSTLIWLVIALIKALSVTTSSTLIRSRSKSCLISVGILSSWLISIGCSIFNKTSGS
ncbi:hypothetical protein RUS48_01940 [Mycoplasmoides gallisepticum]|nr:hypothetical protein RUS48_01940 [Mycoplasmoides gallisepticum]